MSQTQKRKQQLSDTDRAIVAVGCAVPTAQRAPGAFIWLTAGAMECGRLSVTYSQMIGTVPVCHTTTLNHSADAAQRTIFCLRQDPHINNPPCYFRRPVNRVYAAQRTLNRDETQRNSAAKMPAECRPRTVAASLPCHTACRKRIHDLR